MVAQRTVETHLETKGNATEVRGDSSKVLEKKSMRFAISYTVKNESRLLRSAIDYHLAAGCSRIYIYWDRTTDDSESLVSFYPCVIARNSIRPEELTNAPKWITDMLPVWDEDMDVRKRINTYYATERALAEGIDWLINIDPDELILMDRTSEQIDSDHILKHLRKVPDDIDQVHLPNLESVPTSAAESSEPFADCIYFLNRFPITENIWRYSRALLIRISKSPWLIAWYDYLFYQIRFSGSITRLMRDPKSGSPIPAGYFLGYSTHKSFIRVKTHADFDFVIHHWRRYLRSPRNMQLGNILHCDMLDAGYFSAKFRQREPSEQEKLFYLRYRLALVARNSSVSELQEFFNRYIAIPDPDRRARLKKKGIIVEISAVSNFMKARRKTFNA